MRAYTVGVVRDETLHGYRAFALSIPARACLHIVSAENVAMARRLAISNHKRLCEVAQPTDTVSA